MLSPIVRDVQRQRCSKRGSGDGQRSSIVIERSVTLATLLLRKILRWEKERKRDRDRDR